MDRRQRTLMDVVDNAVDLRIGSDAVRIGTAKRVERPRTRAGHVPSPTPVRLAARDRHPWIGEQCTLQAWAGMGGGSSDQRGPCTRPGSPTLGSGGHRNDDNRRLLRPGRVVPRRPFLVPGSVAVPGRSVRSATVVVCVRSVRHAQADPSTKPLATPSKHAPLTSSRTALGSSGRTAPRLDPG